MRITPEFLDELERGLEGVTPGPWNTDPECGHESVLGPDGVMVADCAIFFACLKFSTRSEDGNRANAAHIARCDPDTTRALIALARKGMGVGGENG